MSTRRNRILAASIAAAALASAAACSSESTTSTEGSSAPAGTTAGSTKGTMVQGMLVEDAWCRESPMVDGAGACYATLVNHTDEDDGLVGVTVSASVAGEAQIHNTVSASTDDTMGGGTTGSSMAEEMAEDAASDMHSSGSMDMGSTGSSMMDDMMTMVEVDEIEVPAGETVMLKPGGYHIMLMELAEPLEAGTTIELTLEFHESGSQKVNFEVRSA